MVKHQDSVQDGLTKCRYLRVKFTLARTSSQRGADSVSTLSHPKAVQRVQENLV